MGRAIYGEQSYGERGPAIYASGGLREQLGESVRSAWASPAGQAQRAALREAGQRTASRAYGQAAARVGLGRAYYDAARSGGVSQAYRNAWGSTVF